MKCQQGTKEELIEYFAQMPFKQENEISAVGDIYLRYTIEEQLDVIINCNVTKGRVFWREITKFEHSHSYEWTVRERIVWIIR